MPSTEKTNADNLRLHKRKRQVCINRITELYVQAITAKSDPSKVSDFLTRYEALEGNYYEFKELHNELVSLVDLDTEFDLEDAIRKQVDEYYFSIKAVYCQLEPSPPLSPPAASGAPSVSTPHSHVRLPKISIDKFSGDPRSWQTFFDLFNSLIHTNVDLSNIEKFQYLLSYLDKEPLNLVKTVPLSEANYQTAFDLLVKRYQNKRLLATNALNLLLNVVLKSSNVKELRRLLDTFSENLSILSVLGFNVNDWDFILFNVLLQKIENQIRTQFELEHSGDTIPTYKQLCEYLENHCKALEAVHYMPGSNKPLTKPLNSRSSFFTSPQNDQTLPNSPQSCCVCKNSHFVSKCPKFIEKTPSQRYDIAKQNRLCLNCLSSSHKVKECQSNFHCRICKFSHHTLLHFEKQSQTPDLPPCIHSKGTKTPEVNSKQSGTSTLCSSVYGSTTVLLSTALIEIKDCRGNFQIIRVLMDSASQGNFISEKCVNRLGLRRISHSEAILGLNQMQSMSSKGMTHCVVRPVSGSNPIIEFEAIVLSKLCVDMPSFAINTSEWSHIKNLKLADKNFWSPGPIDMLLGAEFFSQILLPGKIQGQKGQATAFDSEFGWLLLGKVDNPNSFSSPSSSFCTVLDGSLEEILQKFWKVEQVNVKVPPSSEDVKCEEIFSKTVSRTDTGRFIVSLPFQQIEPDLGNSFDIAHRRFMQVENRLIKNPSLYKQYLDFMQDYLDSGHMSTVPESESKKGLFYIPHHCVLKPDSSTTKLRVVFDASCKSSSGLSLNDILFSGPKLQQDVSSILVGFRVHNVVVTADIKQMYRQILVMPEHRQYQRILWRFSPEERLQEFTLNTVTYGVKSSPYLALRTLQELASQECDNFPNASRILQRSCYVDDAFFGCDSVSEALSNQQELIKLLSKGGFKLRKWASNHTELLAAVEETDRQISLDFDKDEPSFVKVLGLQWSPSSDCFFYSYTPLDKPCTKRNILSEIARTFDPLGFLSPITLAWKHILQQLWLEKIDWDETPPKHIIDSWNQIKRELPELLNFRLSRQIKLKNTCRLELHGFSDASIRGYAAVVFVRGITQCGDIFVRLVCAKSKVAPLKTVSMPRLELCGAVLLTNLLSFAVEALSDYLSFISVFAWCDSQIVLTWLNSSAHRWKTFIANRVTHIHDTFPNLSWHYVASEFNPADCASRGLTPKQFLDHSMWFFGPPWLSLSQEHWPESRDLCAESDLKNLLEEKTVSLVSNVGDTFLDYLLNKFSRLSKILRILSYVTRFSNNCRKQGSKLSGPLVEVELNYSLLLLVKYVQSCHFSEISDRISKNQPLEKSLRKLAPFIDDNGIIRVGGRLRNSDLSFDSKFPILLPRNHCLTELIILDAHEKYLHAGFRTLHNLLLQRFWILSARRAIQHCLSRCIRCFRTRPQSYVPYMGDLPSYRVSQIKAFSHVAIDFCGPFFITMSRHRGNRSQKAYVCVFVCTATKAVHLELCSDLSSAVFLACFRRFVARRGRVTDVSSDGGTNFVGANRQLIELSKAACGTLSISWHFSPPGGPHFNGLSEAGVKVFKSHLVKVVGDQILTYEELNTVITQIEAVLNSRPLYAQSSDPNDLSPLTPGHFLTLEPLNSLPDEDLSQVRLNTLSRWQLVQRIHADFWKRWHVDYLNTLQQRSKWIDPQTKIELNTLVLIKHENKTPLNWTLGRVVELHPGSDGNVRVVTVKTATGFFRRPVVKLCPLPMAQG